MTLHSKQDPRPTQSKWLESSEMLVSTLVSVFFFLSSSWKKGLRQQYFYKRYAGMVIARLIIGRTSGGTCWEWRREGRRQTISFNWCNGYCSLSHVPTVRMNFSHGRCVTLCQRFRPKWFQRAKCAAIMLTTATNTINPSLTMHALLKSQSLVVPWLLLWIPWVFTLFFHSQASLSLFLGGQPSWKYCQ